MNNVQKISLIVGIVFSLLWLLSAYENGFQIFDSEWWEYGFDEWYLMLWFALAIGSFVTFFLFKNKQ